MKPNKNDGAAERPLDLIVSGWQPIATAPKDGTEILAFGGLGYMVVCWLEHSDEHRRKNSEAHKKGAMFTCYCGTQFWRKPNEIVAGNAKFCSRACSNSRRKHGF